MLRLVPFFLPTLACLGWMAFEAMRADRQRRAKLECSSKHIIDAYVAVVVSLILPLVALLVLSR
jgi:hypothetical protein